MAKRKTNAARVRRPVAVDAPIVTQATLRAISSESAAFYAGGAVPDSDGIVARSNRLAEAYQPREPMVAGHDGQPPEFVLRRDYVYSNGQRETTESPENINYSRVKWLLNHRRIEKRQYDAAEKLSKHWEKSQIMPSASRILVGAGGANHAEDIIDSKITAGAKFAEAQNMLGRNWAIIQLVVIDNVSVEQASARLRMHPKFGMGALGAALHFLADHYGLS